MVVNSRVVKEWRGVHKIIGGGGGGGGGGGSLVPRPFLGGMGGGEGEGRVW